MYAAPKRGSAVIARAPGLLGRGTPARRRRPSASRGRRALDRVLQAYDAGLVDLLAGELQRRTRGRRRQQRNATAEQHRDDSHLDAVDEADVEQAAKERAAAEQPNVLP